MKQLTCEMCGSTDLMKDGGVFICQSCGCKYSVEEAKKMMVEGTVEISGVVKIDRSDNYNNLIQLARDAFVDGRFDGAYSYCSQAMMINPNGPELIAMQGLSILGKEDFATDVPSSCVNSMRRIIAILPDAKLSYDENGEILQSVKKYIDIVAKLKKDLFYEQIKTLNSQKFACDESDEKEAKSVVMTQALFGDVFAQQKAQSDLEKVREKLHYNEGLNSQINKIRTKLKKVEAFSDTYKKEIDLVLKKVRKEESDYKEARRNKYWEEHKEERLVLDLRLSELEDQLKSINSCINEKKEEIKKSEQMSKAIVDLSSYIKREEMRAEIRKLSEVKNSLGIFKGKEKKALINQIDVIRSQMPTDNDINKEHEEKKKNMQPELNRLKKELLILETQASELKHQINGINEEINKDR